MKKFFKYLGRIVLAIFLLLFFLVFLLYLPPVQTFLKNQAVAYFSETYNLTLKIGHFRLGFPLDLVLEDVYAGATPQDTLVSVESLHVKIGVSQIFRQQLSVDDLKLQKVKFNLSDDSSRLELNVKLEEMNLFARQVDLKKKRVDADHIFLCGGEVFLQTGDGVEPDTVVAEPLDWEFRLGRIELRQLGYRMNTTALPYLGVGVAEGDLIGGIVNMGTQVVRVDTLNIAGGWCDMELAASGENGQVAIVSQDTLPALPWTVTAGTLGMTNGSFRMGTAGKSTAELVLSGIKIQIDSVFNQGTVVRAQLKNLQAVQQDGLTLTSMQADVVMDTTETSVHGAYIRTQNSWLDLNVQTDTDVGHLLQQEPLTVNLKGTIGLADVLPFYPDVPHEIRRQKVNINTAFTVTGKRLQMGQLILDMPGHFKITGSGSLSSWQDMKRMKGTFILRGELPDVTFAQSFLGKQGVHIPRHIDLLTRLKADRGSWDAFMRMCCGQGCLTLDGVYKIPLQDYDAALSLNNFPLDQFLPADSLGKVTASVRLSGQDFSWQKARAEVNAHIRECWYRGHEYRDVVLEAALDKTRLKGSLTSKDPDALLDLIFRADSVGHEYVADLSGRIGEIDVQALHFAPEPFTFRSDVDIHVTMGARETYSLQLKLDSLQISDAYRKYLLGNLGAEMESDWEKTTFGMQSGDLTAEFKTDTSLLGFVSNIGKVTAVIQEQIEARDVNMELVREDLPPFSLHLRSAQNNAVTRFLKSRDMGFRNMAVDIVSRKRSGLRVGVIANAPYFGTVRLDSVQLGAWQTGKSLMYSLSAGSSSEAWKGLFNINLTGRMQGDRFRIELKQKDAQGKLGFDLGINTTLGDSAILVSLFPMNPILGYSRWIVNADNQIRIASGGKIKANLRMAYLNKLVSIQSLPDEGDRHDRLQIEIAGVDLNSLSEVVPFMPQLAGKLNTDLSLYSRQHEMGVDGSIQVVDLDYQQQHIGTLDLDLKYVAGNRFTDHAIRFELKIDSIQRAIAEGSFSTADENREIRIDMDIPSLPLYVVNAFVPADLIKLGGELTGDVRFRGTIDTPELNGGLAFRDGRADVVMLGTTFRLDTNRITVQDGRILFRKYRFIAPNNSNMILDGDVTLTPFDRMGMNLAVDANNFELVNVRKNETSLIYGKAYADIHSRLSGAFSNLSVTGNINLLNRTAITYTLRSSDPAMVDKSADLVRFVSFRDTTLNDPDELTNRVNTSSFALRMLLEIGDQVRLGVDLSEDGSNHVSIQGGGNLVLAMNPEGGMTLSGKYILTGGTVEYNVPIVGKKEFSIQSGSFVEWTGNVMNPLLNISASAQVKANVEDGDQARQVVFEAIIRIQNTLNHPDITFDLSAPNDMVIQNQLMTFSPEERTRQALNLLIYNTYTAPGAAKSGSNGNMANNAIYSFVENELNKYTRKAGLTVGFDSHNTDENTTRTDVTYQFSRQLFNDRVRVKIGGRISTDSNEGQGSTLQDNLVDDISIEYVLTRKRNLYVKVFRHSNYESVLDGEVTQTGVGIVWRKNFRKFKDLFKNNKRLLREKQERTKNENN